MRAQGVIALLRKLVTVLPGGLAAHIAELSPGIKALLADPKASSRVKISCLHLITDILASHPTESFSGQMPDLTEVSGRPGGRGEGSD